MEEFEARDFEQVLVDALLFDTVVSEAFENQIGETDLEVTDVATFQDAGLMTNNKGVVVTLNDGREFQVAIVQSRGDGR